MSTSQADELTAIANGVAFDMALPFDSVYSVLDRARHSGPDALCFQLPPRWLPRWRAFLATLKAADDR